MYVYGINNIVNKIVNQYLWIITSREKKRNRRIKKAFRHVYLQNEFFHKTVYSSAHIDINC